MFGIHMNRTEEERVASAEAKIAKRDNARTKRSVKYDELFNNMNSNHLNIKLTV